MSQDQHVSGLDGSIRLYPFRQLGSFRLSLKETDHAHDLMGGRSKPTATTSTSRPLMTRSMCTHRFLPDSIYDPFEAAQDLLRTHATFVGLEI